MSLIKPQMFTGANGIYINCAVDSQNGAYEVDDNIIFGIGTFQSFTNSLSYKRHRHRGYTTNTFRSGVNAIDIKSEPDKCQNIDDNIEGYLGKYVQSEKSDNENGVDQREHEEANNQKFNTVHQLGYNLNEDSGVTEPDLNKTKDNLKISSEVCDKIQEDINTFHAKDKKMGDDCENRDHDKLLCSICNENRKITNYCLTCDFLTCFNCEKEHQSNEHEFVKHERKPGLETYSMCVKHEKYDLDLFCLHCETYICVACKALTHVNHICFDLKYDNDFVRPVEHVDEETDKALLDTVTIEQIVSIATGIEWNKCLCKKTARRYCLTFPCRLL